MGGIMHHNFQFVLNRRISFSKIAAAFEHNDALLDARIAQTNTLRHTCNSQRVNIFEQARNRYQTMSVCIRFNDRHDSTAGGCFAQSLEIMADSRRLDDRNCGFRHEKPPSGGMDISGT
jgi:hypothetical protein